MSDSKVNIDIGHGRTITLERDDSDPARNAADEIARLEHDAAAEVPRHDGTDSDDDGDAVHHRCSVKLARGGT